MFWSSESGARAAGLLVGFVADRMLGDPRRFHPVAGFGTLASSVETKTYRDAKAAGFVHVVVLVGGTVVAGAVVEAASSRAGWGGRALVTAVAAWSVLGGTSLARTGEDMAVLLEREDTAAGRRLLPSLCGRDPSELDIGALARAALESVAENTSDAMVGAVFWGALCGVPGLLAYRATNTLDAMIGYRSAKYTNFGWAAARWDDVVNLVPARVTGVLTALVAPSVGGSVAGAVSAWRRDAANHPSPNAGVAEATAAGALGVSLGGRTEYSHGVEMRPVLGRGNPPSPRDLRRGVQLSRAVQVGAAVGSAALAVAIGELRLRGRERGGRIGRARLRR
ncbi:cobalamin biosynthesis protein [Rhodococcus sp. NPDC058521]|uniref:cobalamin biosynthesis protein n=1 Tax=Rhodococcus sp. NPDC058521 TaxID=3346536 RepID=UPI00365AAC53